MNNIMFSSRSDSWSTPYAVFKLLDDEFSFNLDPCADDFNHKCKKYFTKCDDGLLQSWSGYRVFCNPPYGREISKWIEKACYEVEKNNCELVVLLVPARTDTKWFHNYLLGKYEIRFVKGRIRFGSSLYPAPFPSMIVVVKLDKLKKS